MTVKAPCPKLMVNPLLPLVQYIFCSAIRLQKIVQQEVKEVL
jgi:hypothetical protein